MSIKLPKISIGMPVYNGESYIKDSIQAILNQTFCNFELIISDNASTDNTEAVCNRYAQKDDRICYYRNAENVGASDNYNAVLKHAKGKYFKWASSNDFIESTFLARCIAILDENPDVVLCYPKTRLFTDTIQNFENFEDKLDLQDNSAFARFIRFMDKISLNNVMNGVIRTEVLKRTPLIKPFYSSDVCLMGELSLHGKFFEIPEYLFYRRMDPETATKLKSDIEVRRHYDPNLKNPMLFQNWKQLAAYFSAVGRAPLNPPQKMRLFLRLLTKESRWSRHKLMGDVSSAFRVLLHQFAAPFKKA